LKVILAVLQTIQSMDRKNCVLREFGMQL